MEDLDAACSDYEILTTLIENGSIKDQAIIKQVNAAVNDFCDSSRASYYYQRGVAYYNLKEYQKALNIYTEGLKYFPTNSMMLSFKGNAHLALLEFQDAIPPYTESLKNKDNFIDEIRINPRFTNASEDQIKSFCNAHLATTYYSLSECKVNTGKLEEALTDINIGLKYLPEGFNEESASYYNLRGNIYFINGKYEEAFADFDKAIQIKPNYSLAYLNRAIAKISLADKVEISSYTLNGNIGEQPLNLNWKFPNKNALKKSESKIISALSDCNMAIDGNENYAYAYYVRGQLKQILKFGGFCMDYFTAQELGFPVEEELLSNCAK